MGCFLSCLKADDDEDHLLPTSRHQSRGVVTSRNPLSLFLSRAFKRKEDRSLLDRGNLGLGSLRDDGGNRGGAVSGSQRLLRGEPCRNLESEKSEVLSHSKDSESLRFHSRLPYTSFEKLQTEVQSSIPATPITFCQEWENGKDSLEHTPWSSAYIAHDTQFVSRCSKDERTKQIHNTVHETETNAASASASPPLPTPDIQRRSKSLRFECETDLSSRGYKQSPYPTPLKISDEMQTPGTVYPATFIDQPNDNKPLVRSQILYSDNHLAKNISQYEILEEEGIHPKQDSGELSSSFEYVQNATLTPKKDSHPEQDLGELSSSLEHVQNATPTPIKGSHSEQDSGKLSSSFGHVQNTTLTPKKYFPLEQDSGELISSFEHFQNAIPTPKKCFHREQDSVVPSSSLKHVQNTTLTPKKIFRPKQDSGELSSSFELVQNVTPTPKKGFHCEQEGELSSSFELVQNATPTPKNGFHSEQDSGELSSSFEYVRNATPTLKKSLKEVSYEDECKEEASLSWLKNASVISEERKSGKETSHNQIIPNLCESPSDRPVLGIVDAHWNEEENPQIPSPKLWYDNGIPNTTNKYKEGQKVNWHATPFEARLEKALSDKSFISQRNHVCGKPSTLENEDNNTAPSQLQHSTHPNL